MYMYIQTYTYTIFYSEHQRQMYIRTDHFSISSYFKNTAEIQYS